jgi:hypothetical protein
VLDKIFIEETPFAFLGVLLPVKAIFVDRYFGVRNTVELRSDTRC